MIGMNTECCQFASPVNGFALRYRRARLKRKVAPISSASTITFSHASSVTPRYASRTSRSIEGIGESWGLDKIVLRLPSRPVELADLAFGKAHHGCIGQNQMRFNWDADARFRYHKYEGARAIV